MAKLELNSPEMLMVFNALLTLNDGANPTVDYGINFTVSRISEGLIRFAFITPQKDLVNISLNIGGSVFTSCLSQRGPIATDGGGDIVSIDVFTAEEDVNGIQLLSDLPGMRLYAQFTFERV